MVLKLYISFFIINFIFCKIVRSKAEANEWSDVWTTLFYSSISIIGTVLLLWYFIQWIAEEKSDPPKFL